MGGTGYQPVPPGYQPGGREGTWIWNMLHQTVRMSIPVSRGRLPRDTGRLPVLPGGGAVAISEFEFHHA